MEQKKICKYDSGVNIMGSIPDYNVMLDYISDTYGITEGSTGAFEFRTEKSLKRFIAGIEACIANCLRATCLYLNIGIGLCSNLLWLTAMVLLIF